jgi:ATP-dependent Clp protease ATP-binding subunit ClpA
MGEMRVALAELLRQTIRPEFLNRIDEVVLFKPLLKSELKQIIDIQLQKVGKKLSENNMSIEIEEGVRDFILQHGFDITFGARPLKRTIQRYLINPLAAELLMNKYESGDTIVVSYPGAGKLSFGKR